MYKREHKPEKPEELQQKLKPTHKAVSAMHDNDDSSPEVSPARLSGNSLKQKRDPKLRLLEKVDQIIDDLGLEERKKPTSKLNLTELPSQKDDKSTFQLLCPIAGCAKMFIISVYPRRVLFHSLQNHISANHKSDFSRRSKGENISQSSTEQSKLNETWELCRCCLKQEPEVIPINAKIKALFADVIQHNLLDDGSICAKCSDNLQRFGRFKQQIIKEHERLMTFTQEASDVKEEPQEPPLFVFADSVASAAEIKVEPTIFDWQLDEEASEAGSDAGSLQEKDVDLSSGSDCELFPERKFKREKKNRANKSEEIKTAGRYSCDHCDLTFLKKSRLAQHKSRHKFLKDELGKRIKYPCDQCDLTFLLESRLRLHKNKVHSNGILCPHCQSEFSTIELMRQHSRFAHRVTGGRTTYKKRNYDYELCTVCGKQVRHDLMKSHVDLVHIAEKNIICTDCGKAFLLPIYLKTHRQVHHSNGVRPFICDFCGKGSFTKRLLIIHIKRHHTVKVEVRCNLCLKGFFTKQDLKRHLRRMHPAGEEDDGLRANLKTNLFHCPFCSRTYQGMKMCQMHMKASHPGQSFDKAS